MNISKVWILPQIDLDTKTHQKHLEMDELLKTLKEEEEDGEDDDEQQISFLLLHLNLDLKLERWMKWFSF